MSDMTGQAALGKVNKANSDILAAISLGLGRPGLIGTLGDSRLNNGFASGPGSGTASSATIYRLQQIGMQHHVRRGTGQRVDFPASLAFAVGGYTTNDLIYETANNAPNGGPPLNRAIAAAVAANAIGIVLLCGTNDRGTTANLPAETTIANLDTVISAILAARLICFLCPETARGTAAYTSNRLTTIQQFRHQRVADWQVQQRNRPGVVLLDYRAAWNDPTSSTGDVRLGVTFDGLHASPIGGAIMASPLITWVNNHLPLINLMPTSNSGVYNDPEFLGGSLNTNPMLFGTDGATVAGGATIVNSPAGIATSCTIAGSNATGLTITTSKFVDTTGTIGTVGAEWQKVVVSGTPTVANPNVELQAFVNPNSAISTGGTQVYATAEIYVDPTSTGYQDLFLGIRLTDNSSVITTEDGGVGGTTNNTAAMSYSGQYLTLPVTVPSDYTITGSQRVRVQARLIQNTAANLTFYVRSLKIAKVV